MKKILAAAMLISMLVKPCFAGGDTKFSEDYVKLLDTHAVKVFVEGTNVDEYVFAARGSLTFIYMSGEMQDDISNSATAPNWLVQCNNDISTGKKGYSNFIIYLEANQPWMVNPSEIKIGDYRLKEEDVLSAPQLTPFGIDASLADEWAFTIQVPAKDCKPGTEIEIGYGKYLVKFTVPKNI